MAEVLRLWESITRCIVWWVRHALEAYTADYAQKKIRHMVYRDHYHKGKDELQMTREQSHVGTLPLL